MLKRIFIVFGAAVLLMAVAPAQVRVIPAQQCYQDYPPGDDLFSTTSNVGIANNPGCANPMPVTLSGTFTVHRGTPVRPPDNRCEIPTEIISMSQRDPSGRIQLRIQAPPNRSLGRIKQRAPGQDFQADSFFNVLFEVTGVPGITGTLFNRPENPKRMSSVISSIPPFKHVYEFPDCIPLYRREDPEPRQPRAWITADHTPQDPGQCDSTGQRCGTYQFGACGVPSCVCGATSEGTGVCIDGGTPCPNSYCDSTNDCNQNAGELCLVDSCCPTPRRGVCLAPRCPLGTEPEAGKATFAGQTPTGSTNKN